MPAVGINKDILVKIENFTEYNTDSGTSYSMKPTFIFDIGEILHFYGGRFSVEIIHINDSLTLSYRSEDMFFNRGVLPAFDSEDFNVDFNIPANNSSAYCSGLRYLLSNCTIDVTYEITGINNLNRNMATFKKVTLNSPLLEEPYEFSNDDLKNYTFEFDVDNVDWAITRSLCFNSLTSLDTNIPISGTINNAFGSTEFHKTINILLYSQVPENSTDAIEIFNNEIFRRKFNEDPITLSNWESDKSILGLSELMVKPGIRINVPTRRLFRFYG